MLKYQANLGTAATSVRLSKPSHRWVGQVLLNNSELVIGPACPGPLRHL